MSLTPNAACRERVDILLRDKELQAVVLAGIHEIVRTWDVGKKKHSASKRWRFSTQIIRIKTPCDRLTTEGWDEEGDNHTHIGAILCRAAIMAKDWREKHGELNDFTWNQKA